jgi:hypothetical protein
VAADGAQNDGRDADGYDGAADYGILMILSFEIF